DIIKSFAPGPARDLVKIARGQDRGLLPVEFAELREEHGANRHVDADAERVGAANYFQQTPLCELLGEHTVFGQKARVVQADAVPQPAFDLWSIRAGEFESFNRICDGVLLFARRHVDAREVLRAL